ncbi:MAG: carboxypeptidase regulatory-like domain-containing protein [Planctomycetia bacterium]
MHRLNPSPLRAEAGRAGLVVVALVAVAALAFLVVGDPLKLFGPSASHDAAGTGEPGLDADASQAGGADASAKRSGPELAALYGAGDLGGLRMRLMDAVAKKPKAGQAVLLRSRSGSETKVASDASGEVLFGQLMPGRGWQVLVEGSGFRAVSLVNITIQPGGTTDLGDILLGANVALRGRVIDPSGKPVPRATVAAFLPERGTAAQGLVVYLVDQALRMPGAREEVVSDDEGMFSFVTLSDGMYSIVARHPGYGTRQQNEVVVKAESAASPLVVRLGEGAKVTGKVTDAEGRGVPGARVVAMRDMGQRFSLNGSLERDEAVTDGRGQFLIDTLNDGSSYRFGVMADGFAPAWDQAAVEVQKALERNFTLQRGGYIEGVVREEGAGTPVADATVTVVVGRFSMGGMGGGRGGRGGGQAGAAQPGQQPAGDPTTPASARTDAQGRFKIGPVVPGPVMSAVVKASGYTSFSASMWTGNPWPDVAVEQVGTVDVSLKRGGSITGRVRSADGLPIAGANVVAAGSGMMGMAAMWVGSPTATTDPTGAFTIAGVPPGDYNLTADAPGFAQADAGSDSTKVTVPEAGGTLTMDLVLTAAGVVTGRVTDTKGEPVAGARVRTRADMGRMFRGGAGGGAGMGARMVTALATRADLTDAQGRYRLEGVPTATEWSVEVEAEEYVSTQSERMQLKPGEVREMDLVLAGGATLQGRVVGEGGSWVRGARVRVGTLGDEDSQRGFLSGWQMDRNLDPRSFTTDENGQFMIPNVRPGRILLKVEHPDYVVSYKRSLTLASDQVLENHQVLLQRGEVCEGVVKGADGKPIAGALVVVTSRSSGRGEDEPAPAGSQDSVEPSMNAQTDSEGRFRVENIPAGDWNVAVGFAQGHVGWFGASDDNAIKRNVRMPSRDVEFRLKAQEAGSNPFGGGMPRGGGGNAGGRMPAPR